MRSEPLETSSRIFGAHWGYESVTPLEASLARLAAGPSGVPRVLLVSDERRGRRRLVNALCGSAVLSPVGAPPDDACEITWGSSWTVSLPVDPSRCPPRIAGPVELLRGCTLVMAPRPNGGSSPWLDRLLPELLLASRVVLVLNTEQPLSSSEQRWLALVAPWCVTTDVLLVGMDALGDTDRADVAKRVFHGMRRIGASIPEIDPSPSAHGTAGLERVIRGTVEREAAGHAQTWALQRSLGERAGQRAVAGATMVPVESGTGMATGGRTMVPDVPETQLRAPSDLAGATSDEGYAAISGSALSNRLDASRWRECPLCGGWSAKDLCEACGQSGGQVQFVTERVGPPALRVLVELWLSPLRLSAVVCARAPWVAEAGRVQAAVSAAIYGQLPRTERELTVLLAQVVRRSAESIEDLPALAELDVLVTLRLRGVADLLGGKAQLSRRELLSSCPSLCALAIWSD